MFRIHYWFCISMVAVAVYDTSSYTLEVTPVVTPAARPQDYVVFVCKLSGIKTEKVEYYWWRDVDENTPIYTFLEFDKIDEITEGYRYMVINETHIISEVEISSILMLRTNLTSPDHLRCEFAMKDGRVASRAAIIDVERPGIHIDVKQVLPIPPDDSNSNQVLIATCTVFFSAGKPEVAVFCNDDDGNDIIPKPIEFHTDGLVDHFNASRRAEVPISCRQINCTVTDARGTYYETRNTLPHEMPKIVDVRFWVVVTLFVMCWVIAAVLAICCLIRRRNKHSVGKGRCNSFTRADSITCPECQKVIILREQCKEDGTEKSETDGLVAIKDMNQASFIESKSANELQRS